MPYLMLLGVRCYHLVMTNIAMENPNHKWRFLAGKIIYTWAIFHGYVSHNQRVILNEQTVNEKCSIPLLVDSRR